MTGNLLMLLFLAASFYLGALYKSTAVCTFFLFLSIFAAAGLLQLLFLSKRLCFLLPDLLPESDSQKTVAFTLHVKNKSPFSVTNGRIHVQLTDSWGTAHSACWIPFSAGAGQEVLISGSLSGSVCGKFRLQADKARLYSPGHLLSKTLGLHLSSSVLFYPDFSRIPMKISEAVRYFPADSTGEDQVLAGPAHTAASQIRSFQPGDKVRQIHWKLSARSDELLVRDMGKPNGMPVLLLLQLQNPSGKNPVRVYSAFLDCAASLSFSLLESRCRHFVVWYHQAEQRLMRFPVSSEEELQLCIYFLLHAPVYEKDYDLSSLYRQQYPSDTWQTVLLFNTRLQLYRNRELVSSKSREGFPENLSGISLMI